MDLNEVLFNAAKDGNLLVLKTALEKGADVNERASLAGTALMVASDQGHADVVSILKKAGARE